jgi:hypothetical protein
MASAGADAVPLLLNIIRNDTEEDTDLDRGSHDGSRIDTGVPSRSAAYGLAEIGARAVPGLLDILATATGSRARKCDGFAVLNASATAVPRRLGRYLRAGLI